MLLERHGSELSATTAAMATRITVRATAPAGGGDDALEPAVRAALDVFTAVERTCTRFDESSPLMRANASPERWHRVPRWCFDAVLEAHRAYAQTRGRFDPRILSDLVAMGYDRTLAFGSGPVTLPGPAGGRAPDRVRPRRRPTGPWRPRFRGGRHPELMLGDAPIDLGGIGKGLAVRWATDTLRPHTPSFLIEAGGDCYCAGSAPDGTPWHVGVEDPRGGDGPIAVLALRDRACATSSIRLRRWHQGERVRHHLVDPRTGLPGGDGLLAVTVVAADTAVAEVWSKVLFLAGAGRIGALADSKGIAALWATTDADMVVSRSMRHHVTWTAPA